MRGKLWNFIRPADPKKVMLTRGQARCDAAVNLSFKGKMPFMLIDEPKGGFDTMLADGREVSIEPNKG